MPAEQASLDFAGWTSDELRTIFQQFSGVGSDHDLELEDRFVRGVATLVRKREAIDQTHEDPKKLSVFLLAPDVGGQADLPRKPMLDNGKTTIAGYIWFVNAAVVWGRSKQLEVEDSDGVFRTVTDELDLGDVPTVIVDPSPPKTEVRYYQKGLNALDEYKRVSLHCSEVDLERIIAVVDDVYDQCLKTPTVQPPPNKLWKDADKHWPHGNAEQRVQALLKAAFAREFPSSKYYKVEDEIPGIMGRADLQIAEQDPLSPEKLTYHAVLELKVLRSFSENGKSHGAKKNEESVEKGVRQAGMYRRERGHRIAALCCFDMRKKDDGNKCFEAVSKLAGKLEVALRRWYLYASSELARKALTAPAAA